MPITKTYLPPEARTVQNEDGTETTKMVTPWEVKWEKDEKKDPEGKERHELDDVFKDSAPQMMHDGWKEWDAIGETTITKPDGSTDVVRADKEHLYRSQPGFCVHATRPTFTCNVPWEGSLKREGITRQRILYKDGERIVLEEKHGYHA
jgi:hypothetical protein